MASWRGSLIGAVALAVASFAANAGIFVIAYNRLATPFLQEEQRVANANVILTEVTGAFALIAVLLGFGAYLMLRRAARRD